MVDGPSQPERVAETGGDGSGHAAASSAATLAVLGMVAAAAWAAFVWLDGIDNSPENFAEYGRGLRWAGGGLFAVAAFVALWLSAEAAPAAAEREAAKKTWVVRAGRLGQVGLCVAAVSWVFPTPLGIGRLVAPLPLAVVAGAWGGRAVWVAVRGVLRRRREERRGVGAVLASGAGATLLLIMLAVKLHGLGWASAID